MAIRIIRLDGDPLLRRKSKPVKAFDSKLGELLDDMSETMVAANGIGIAAPQVGVLKRAVIVVLDGEHVELVNPEIQEAEGSQVRSEGCLSVPKWYGMVERPAHIRVTGQDRNGDLFEIIADEYAVHILCHEIDHLDGILFSDKATEMFEVQEREEEDSEEQGEESEDKGFEQGVPDMAEQAAAQAGAQADSYVAGKGE
jgi:peptide deformylase